MCNCYPKSSSLTRLVTLLPTGERYAQRSRMTQPISAGLSVPNSQLSKHLRVELWAESNYITGSQKKKKKKGKRQRQTSDTHTPREADLSRALRKDELQRMDLHSSKNMKRPGAFKCSIKVQTSLLR